MFLMMYQESLPPTMGYHLELVSGVTFSPPGLTYVGVSAPVLDSPLELNEGTDYPFI